MPGKDVRDGGLSSGGHVRHQPHLRRLLATLGLDVAYHRGQGVHLYYHDSSGRETEALDLLGGYGASLFGHAHPALVARAQDVLASQQPFLAQASVRGEAEALARELSERCGGDYRAVFANSGAEAVEAAIKHALLETSGSTFIALEGAFHGKTLGAVQLTSNPAYREPFGNGSFRVERVAPNDARSLAAAFDSIRDLAGMFLEPIQGEGGVRALDADFARLAAQLCRDAGIPLIADECQTGMGRTGQFLASTTLGIEPDYVLLSKSLGGGIAKAAVALIRTDRYIDEFDLTHTSTFAADELSCAVARRAVELVTPEFLSAVTNAGDSALRELRALAAEFPEVIADVRGTGLMLGVEFWSQSRSPSFLLRLFSSRDELVQAIAAYLFHRHRIRIAPTLSDPWTLRLQPAADIRPRHWSQLLIALRDVCQRLSADDAMGLTDFVVDRCSDQQQSRLVRHEAPAVAFTGQRIATLSKGLAPTRVAWLCHMIDAEDLIQQELDSDSLGFESVERYLARWSPLASPVVMNAVDVESRTGDRVCLVPIMLPVTSRMMKSWLERRELALCRTLIDHAVAAAGQLGCQLVALGQYTSIVTRAGQSVSDAPPLGLSSGNSYAIALACQAIEAELHDRGWDSRKLVLGIAGGAGNIGQTCAEVLAATFASTVLVGRPGSTRRLNAIARRLPRAKIATTLNSLQSADVVISAVNSVDSPLESEHLAPNAIVCDLSVPASLSDETRELRPDVTVVRGGIVQLPHGEELGIASFPLDDGITFGCMAEGLLLGYERIFDRSFTGRLSREHVRRIAAMASKHGFELSRRQTDCVFGSSRRERTHATR